MTLPPFNEAGDLPVGIHSVTLADVVQQLGTVTPQRRLVCDRLERICRVAFATGHVARLIVFGSFVTSKPEPNDVDVFVLMEDAFDATHLAGETQLLFDHRTAQSHFGASFFWLRRMSAWEGEQAAIEWWQVKRGGGLRGIIEIVPG